MDVNLGLPQLFPRPGSNFNTLKNKIMTYTGYIGEEEERELTPYRFMFLLDTFIELKSRKLSSSKYHRDAQNSMGAVEDDLDYQLTTCLKTITGHVMSDNDLFFELFCERNILSCLVPLIKCEGGSATHLKIAILETCCLLLHNVHEPSSIYLLLSNNTFNELVLSFDVREMHLTASSAPTLTWNKGVSSLSTGTCEYRDDDGGMSFKDNEKARYWSNFTSHPEVSQWTRTNVEDKTELVSWYISLLKALTVHVDKSTVRLFYNNRYRQFPVFSQAVQFISHSDAIVRTHARAITLSLYQVKSSVLCNFFLKRSTFFNDVVAYWLQLGWNIHQIRLAIQTDGGSKNLLRDFVDYIEREGELMDYFRDIQALEQVDVAESFLYHLSLYGIIPLLTSLLRPSSRKRRVKRKLRRKNPLKALLWFIQRRNGFVFETVSLWEKGDGPSHAYYPSPLRFERDVVVFLISNLCRNIEEITPLVSMLIGMMILLETSVSQFRFTKQHRWLIRRRYTALHKRTVDINHEANQEQNYKEQSQNIANDINMKQDAERSITNRTSNTKRPWDRMECWGSWVHYVCYLSHRVSFHQTLWLFNRGIKFVLKTVQKISPLMDFWSSSHLIKFKPLCLTPSCVIIFGSFMYLEILSESLKKDSACISWICMMILPLLVTFDTMLRPIRDYVTPTDMIYMRRISGYPAMVGCCCMGNTFFNPGWSTFTILGLTLALRLCSCLASLKNKSIMDIWYIATTVMCLSQHVSVELMREFVMHCIDDIHHILTHPDKKIKRVTWISQRVTQYVCHVMAFLSILDGSLIKKQRSMGKRVIGRFNKATLTTSEMLILYLTQWSNVTAGFPLMRCQNDPLTVLLPCKDIRRERAWSIGATTSSPSYWERLGSLGDDKQLQHLFQGFFLLRRLRCTLRHVLHSSLLKLHELGFFCTGDEVDHKELFVSLPSTLSVMDVFSSACLMNGPSQEPCPLGLDWFSPSCLKKSLWIDYTVSRMNSSLLCPCNMCLRFFSKSPKGTVDEDSKCVSLVLSSPTAMKQFTNNLQLSTTPTPRLNQPMALIHLICVLVERIISVETPPIELLSLLEYYLLFHTSTWSALDCVEDPPHTLLALEHSRVMVQYVQKKLKGSPNHETTSPCVARYVPKLWTFVHERNGLLLFRRVDGSCISISTALLPGSPPTGLGDGAEFYVYDVSETSTLTLSVNEWRSIGLVWLESFLECHIVVPRKATSPNEESLVFPLALFKKIQEFTTASTTTNVQRYVTVASQLVLFISQFNTEGGGLFLLQEVLPVYSILFYSESQENPLRLDIDFFAYHDDDVVVSSRWLRSLGSVPELTPNFYKCAQNMIHERLVELSSQGSRGFFHTLPSRYRTKTIGRSSKRNTKSHAKRDVGWGPYRGMDRHLKLYRLSLCMSSAAERLRFQRLIQQNFQECSNRIVKELNDMLWKCYPLCFKDMA